MKYLFDDYWGYRAVHMKFDILDMAVAQYEQGLKKDCVNAWRYYNESMALGRAPVTEEYKTDLKKLCPNP